MTSDAVWDETVRAHRDYVIARDRFYAGDPAPTLAHALTSTDHPPAREAALCLLIEVGATRPEVIEELVPQLAELALSSDQTGRRVREILALLEPEVLGPRLEPTTRHFLVDDAERDASEYRGLIELLDSAHLPVMRDEVLAYARRSPDPDTRMMAERFADRLLRRNAK